MTTYNVATLYLELQEEIGSKKESLDNYDEIDENDKVCPFLLVQIITPNSVCIAKEMKRISRYRFNVFTSCQMLSRYP